MTIVVAKDNLIAVDSLCTQYGGAYKAFNLKKSYQTENKRWYCVGSGRLSTLQKFQDHLEDKNTYDGFEFNPEDTTEIIVVDQESPNIRYVINEQGVQKLPAEVPTCSGTSELYFMALLDMGMSPPTAIQYVLENNKINYIDYPIWFYNTVTNEEWRLDEDGSYNEI